jgi:oligopeptide/dipeptide ABC transporter ATP-binding protein
MSAVFEVTDASVSFAVSGGSFGAASQRRLIAVDRATFAVEPGECLAIVGESGCGKTTLGRTLLGLYQPSQGSIRFDGEDVTGFDREAMKRFRRRVQMVFQDPYASLNPRMKVGEIVAEPLRVHGIGSPAERRDRAAALLDRVGLPRDAANRFPNAFSGGQRQRIGIARALALEPDVVIADEPVSALDVSVQAQVINLFKELRAQLGLTLIFIAHDLAVVRYVATRIAVMYLGQIVEIGRTEDVFGAPQHPYTQALLSAVPFPDPEIEKTRARIILRSDLPSPIDRPPGCRFHTRCEYAFDACRTVEPVLQRGGRQLAACHLLDRAERSEP